VSLRRRTYPEVVDNLLTTIVKGVAAESHPFPPPDTLQPPFRFRLLQPPVTEIVSVYGSRDGNPQRFRKDIDYTLLDDKQTLEWQEGAALPDSGTLVNINYYPESATPLVTDIQTGSVVRTLAEAVGLEMAAVYAQLQAVYDAAFIDTATGSSLEKVVGLLGIERIAGGRAAGMLEFTRAPGSKGEITLRAGTRVITADGQIEYETISTVTMLEGQNSIRVAARDLEINDPLPADSLVILPIPIAGIATVTNLPTAITNEDETDDQLRARAKNFLHGSERGTLGALHNAVQRQGITADIVEDEETPGLVEITPHAENFTPEQAERLRAAIYEARPAGVRVVIKGVQAPRKINLTLRLTTKDALIARDIRAAQRTARDKISEYFATLPVKEAGSLNRIVGAILSIAEIDDVQILSATLDTGENVLDQAAGKLQIAGFPTVLGELQIADPALPTQLTVTVTFPQGQAPADQPQIQSAVSAAIAYLNTINASELSAVEQVKRVLSYGKLLQVVPLPTSAPPLPRTLEAYDAAAVSPTLPTETTASPYQVQFVVTQESGLSRVLAKATDPAYTLTPFERLSLGSATVQANNG